MLLDLCHADLALSTSSIRIQQVAFGFGGLASDKSLYPSGSLGLVRQTLRHRGQNLLVGTVDIDLSLFRIAFLCFYKEPNFQKHLILATNPTISRGEPGIPGQFEKHCPEMTLHYNFYQLCYSCQ